jgi:hypothetical protein
MALDPGSDRVLLTGSFYVEEKGAYAFVGSTRPRSVPDPNYPPYTGDQAILRLTRSGGWGSSLAVDPARSVVVGGNLGGTASLIARATSGLRLDRGFGSGGRALAKGRLTTLGAIALQPGGGILAAGPMPTSKERAFRLIRLHGGHDRAGPRLSIRLSDDRCSGRVGISVRAKDESPLRRLRVRIDGRRLAAVRRKRVAINARVAPLAGAHRVVARAYDVAGNLGVRSRSFTCPS